MRRLLLALTVACAFATPAAAQLRCSPVDTETFIAEGAARIEDGTVKGDIIRDRVAKAFAAEGGIDNGVIAAFLIETANGHMLVVVINNAGVGLACVGGPVSEAGVAAFKRHRGQDT